MLSNNGLCLHAAVQYVLVLVVNSNRFQILLGYMLLVILPVLMGS